MSHPIIWQRAYDFHPIGHSPPTSLVRDISPEKDANILILQCNDPRNVFYTLYSSGIDDSNSMRRLDFTCSDDEPAVLARNILLYTLILRDDLENQKHLIWNIFYHLLLDDASLSLLIAQCRRLSRLSKDMDAWTGGQYSEFIKIGTQLTLHELHHHWNWYARTETWKDAHKARFKEKLLRYLKKHEKYYRGYVNTLPARATGPMWANAGVVMNEAYHRYWETGVMYTREQDIRNAIRVNPLFAYSNGQQTFATNDFTAPLATFLMADAFCSLHPANSSTWPEPTVDELHAVARSQFHTWCLCFRSCIQSSKVILRHIYSDPLALGLTLQEYSRRSDRTSIGCRVKPWRAAFLVLDGDGFSASPDGSSAAVTFDVIDTANLSDTQGILNVFIACIPLLKPTAWAVLYTETRKVYGDEPVTDSLVQLCGELGTMSLLLDLAPTSYLSGFRSEANTEELVSRQLIPNVNGFVERITWRRPSRLETGDRALLVTASQMEDFLYNICLKMFMREAVSPDDETEGSERERSRAHYCRRSFALLIRYLVSRISTDWRKVVTSLAERMSMSFELMIAKVSLFDYVCQLHQLGVHSGLHYQLGNIVHLDSRLYGRLREWADAPPVVWLAFPVPRSIFKILEEKDAPYNPPISVGVGSELGGESYHFPSFEPFFGSLTVEGRAEHARAYITEDTQGRRGNSPLIVSFCMPTHLLARPPTLEMSVRLLVLKTPETNKFYFKYGNVGRFFELSTTDPRVHILAQPPTLRRDAKVKVVIKPPIPRAVAGPDSISLGFDEAKEKVLTMTARADFADAEIKATLADKATPVDLEHVSHCTVRLKIGSRLHRDMSFPYPINGKKIRIRLSRRESWIEVIAPPSPLGQSPGELSKELFPMITDGSERTPWNLHRLSLGRLPHLSTKSINMLQWVNRHVNFAFSEAENKTRNEPGAVMGTLTLVKSTIASIFKSFVGSKEVPGRSTVMLLRQDGSVEFVLFVTGLRLDAAGHTVVLDGFVPHASSDALRRLIDAMRPKAARITLSDQESQAWKRLLPAMVERCREWAHSPDCQYLSSERGLRSYQPDEWPLCECGQGKSTDTLKRKDWAPFVQHATRVAVSQLFAVSYLEKTCERAVHNMRDILDDQGVHMGDMRLLLEEGGRDGKDHWDTFCAMCLSWLPPGERKICRQCKAQVYCSKECQQLDWQNHKGTCGEGRRSDR